MPRGHPKPKPAREDWQERFAGATMRTHFLLALTQPMLEYLSACADDCEWDREIFHQNPGMRCNWIATEEALTKRGLIRRKPPRLIAETSKVADSALDYKSVCELTPAGEAVVNLLKVGGLFVESLAAIHQGKRKA